MYDAVDDIYCYPGTSVLKNRLGLRTQEKLDEFEAAITFQRADEPLPEGELDGEHYLALHHHLFQDVFDWAGKIRTVQMGKGGSPFCHPENIEREMKNLFEWLKENNFLKGIDAHAFASKAAHFLAELNAIHPFREGNGRTQNSFLKILADGAGHPLDVDQLKRDKMMEAMIESFGGSEEPLAELIYQMVEVR